MSDKGDVNIAKKSPDMVMLPSGRRNNTVTLPRPFVRLLFILCAISFISAVSSASPEEPPEIKEVRYSVSPDLIRVTIELSGPAEFTKNKLTNPERLYFDLKNAKLDKNNVRTQLQINEQQLKAIRIGQQGFAAIRVVFDMASQEYDYKVVKVTDPDRIIIDFFPGSHKDELPASGKENAAAEPASKSIGGNAPKLAQQRIEKRIIIIDPGHGGQDPGAIGPRGLYEKDVVLDVSLKLRALMKRQFPQYTVVLTRDKDIFIPLQERAAFANKHKGDLFISVHANASPNRQTRGVETYLLNYTNDAEAMRVAARENAVSLKKMQQAHSELDLITSSLKRENKRDESVRLAGHIQTALVQAITAQYPQSQNLGVKQALFYVLVGAEMPSALVEVSFISNAVEEKLLAKDAYRKSIASSIAQGINGYFAALPQQKADSLRAGGPIEIPVEQPELALKTSATKKPAPSKYIRK